MGCVEAKVDSTEAEGVGSTGVAADSTVAAAGVMLAKKIV